ncbi:hypothetical protein V3W47_01225 [Deinococcus sp. YIM 134068]|uniref:hypothetical protein n=1 Tax=Deinococcus lichenicola TaxID=3118910 RepID=UPI002F9326D6
MPAADLPTEALTLAWAVQVGAATWEEVVAWADAWILRLSAPTEDLLELSLSARKPNEAFTLLRRLAQRGDPDAALSMLAWKLRDGIDWQRINAVVLASHLADMAALSLDEEPDDVRLPPLPPGFREAAWELYSIADQRSFWLEEGVDRREYDRNLSGEVAAMLQRFL